MTQRRTFEPLTISPWTEWDRRLCIISVKLLPLIIDVPAFRLSNWLLSSRIRNPKKRETLHLESCIVRKHLEDRRKEMDRTWAAIRPSPFRIRLWITPPEDVVLVFSHRREP